MRNRALPRLSRTTDDRDVYPARPMTEIPDTPRSSDERSAAAPPAPTSGSVVRRATIVRLPSGRATAVLAGAMLALGVAIGAAIGPAPDASFAGASRLLPLLTTLAGSGSHSSSPSVQPPAVSAQATPAPAAHATTSRAPTSHGAAASSSPQSTPATPAPTSNGKTSTPKALPPVTHVWLIELSGTTFADALAQPSAAPYIDGQAVPSGTLLSGWSALDGSTFSGDAALIASTPPQLLDTIVQPPCPEGAAGAGCMTGTPGGLTAADEFLKASIATITPTAAYRTSGLIVVAFGSVVSGSDTGLPSGASNATLTSAPPSGVLLISPFVSAGARPTTIAFNPASPRQSLEKLLHH